MKRVVTGLVASLSGQGTAVQALVTVAGLVALAFAIGFHIASVSSISNYDACDGRPPESSLCDPGNPDAGLLGISVAPVALDVVGLAGIAALSLLLLRDGAAARRRLHAIDEAAKAAFVRGAIDDDAFAALRARIRAAAAPRAPEAGTQRFAMLVGGTFLAFIALYSGITAASGLGSMSNGMRPWLIVTGAWGLVVFAASLWACIACFVGLGRPMGSQNAQDEALDHLEHEILRITRQEHLAAAAPARQRKTQGLAAESQAS